jgi:2-C-methyl-D-erythritol 4-phosphate cytidylyltransferase
MMECAIVVAGGSGTRMQSTTPKQFIEIGGLPILMHTVNAFYHYSKNINIILVIPENQFDLWNKLTEKHQFNIPCQLVKGGNTRFDSVKNGLNAINYGGLVAVHDGVRPFVSTQIIRNCFASAQKFGSGIAAVSPKDSLRKLTAEGNSNVDRADYRLMQTPQTFAVDKIKQSYLSATSNKFTDDASVVENSGHQIHLVEGDYKNIKITTPEDIKIAQALLELDNN